MSDHSDYPDGLSEAETLARLTIEEKRRIARAAILEFPHVDHSMLDEWLRDHGATTVPVGSSLQEKTDALLDRCETLIRSGEEPEALDRFVYGQLSPAGLEALGVVPEEVAGREPLDTWKGIYEND